MANKQFRMQKILGTSMCADKYVTIFSPKPKQLNCIWKNHLKHIFLMTVLVFLYVFEINLAPENCFFGLI